MLVLSIFIYIRTETHTERGFYEESHAAAEKEVHGIYPGEGHEAAHAEQLGDFGEGHSFHEHQERYGPFHELHGQFNDGHSRMEHQNMYQHNGGLNEHISGKSNDNGMHGGKMGGHSAAGGGFDGHGGQDGAYGIGGLDAFGRGGLGHGGGTDYGCASCGIGYIGEHGLSGHEGCGAHGANGFHHGNGTAYNGDDAHGGGQLAGHGHGGVDAFGNAHLSGHTDRNHAAFGPEGLLAPAAGELSMGGAYHEVHDGMGHGGVRFFSGPEHAMYHDMQGHGVPANVVDFYDDAGVIDPTTGEFVGGYMHGDTYKGHERSSHKAQEIARNMAAGNGFRRVLVSEGIHGRMHGHYGQGGQIYAGAPAHSAAVGAAEGIKSAHGEINNGLDAALLNTTGMNYLNANADDGFSGNASRILASQSVAKAGELGYQRKIDRNIAAANLTINNDLNMARHIMSSLSPAEHIAGLKTEANLHIGAAQANLASGNIGRATLHMNEARLNGLKATNISLDLVAKQNLLSAKNAAQRGDIAAAKAYESSAKALLKTGRESVAAYANSIGIDTTHHDESVLFGGEVHAEKARTKALEAEKLRNAGMVAEMGNDEVAANNINANAAVTAAEGRAESGFGRELAKENENNVLQTQMSNFESIQQSGVKEAIALQDNMHKISTGNTAPLNKSVADAIEDLSLKEMAGVNNASMKLANDAITGVSPEQMEKVIETNNTINRALSMPTLKDALVIANAGEIAERLVARERENLAAQEAAEKEKHDAQQKLKDLADQRKKDLDDRNAKEREKQNQDGRDKAKTPQETLGIIDKIPEDADTYDINNGSIDLPIKVYDPKIADNQAEKEALEAQDRLKDDLRGAITKNKFDSPLNTIQTEDGYLNLPESVEGLDIDDGRVYYTEEAKARMDAELIDTSDLEHKINTGERKDMANGMGYYLASLSKVRIDYPTPNNPKPKLIAYKPGKVYDISLASGVDVAQGKIVLTPWSLYIRLLRPKVDKPVIKIFPEIIKPVKKEQKVIEAEKNRLKAAITEREALLKIGKIDKSIIINPDGRTFIQAKPAFGVTQHIEVNNLSKDKPHYSSIDETNQNTDQGGIFDLINENKRAQQLKDKEIEYGQSGIDEMIGETETRQHENDKTLGQKTKSKIKNEKELERVSLDNAIVDEKTGKFVDTMNAFNRKTSEYKKRVKKQAKEKDTNNGRKDDEDQHETADLLGLSFVDVERKIQTAFEKNNKREADRNNNSVDTPKIEKDELDGIFGFENKLERLKRKVGNVKRLSNEKLIEMIEDYTKGNNEKMKEYDFLYDGNNPKQAKDKLLQKIRREGFDYLEWRNRVRKNLLQTVKMNKKNNMHVFYRQARNITDEYLSWIRNYLMLPSNASVKVKNEIVNDYKKALNAFQTIFSDDTGMVMSIIKKKILESEGCDIIECSKGTILSFDTCKDKNNQTQAACETLKNSLLTKAEKACINIPENPATKNGPSQKCISKNETTNTNCQTNVTNRLSPNCNPVKTKPAVVTSSKSCTISTSDNTNHSIHTSDITSNIFLSNNPEHKGLKIPVGSIASTKTCDQKNNPITVVSQTEPTQAVTVKPKNCPSDQNPSISTTMTYIKSQPDVNGNCKK